MHALTQHIFKKTSIATVKSVRFIFLVSFVVMAGGTSRVVISPSLLAQIGLNKKIPREFSLGMSEWTDTNCEDSG